MQQDPTVFDISHTGAWIAAIAVGFVVIPLTIFVSLRRRSVRKSIEFKTILVLTARLAEDRRKAQVHPAHFALALTVDPNGRRALAAMGVDTAKLRGLYEARIAALPAGVEEYRKAADQTVHASCERLIKYVAKQPVISIRAWLLAVLVDNELGPLAKRCGATVAAALKVPEVDLPRAGDIVVEGKAVRPDEVHTVAEILGPLFALDETEATAATIAMQCRGSVRFANGSPAIAEQLAQAAREKNARLTARLVAA